MKVRLKQGARTKASADVIHREIEACKVDGVFDLESIVQRAKPKSSPIHDEFTWNNVEAAEKWRLEEARYLARAIEVIHEEASAPTRAWESVTIQAQGTTPGEPDTTKRVFRSIDDIMADPVARDELLIRALKEASSWRRRYANLQELAQVHMAIDQTVTQTKAA